MTERERLTMDSPTTNTGNMLNLAYAKDGKVYLRYGVEDVNLCDYVSNFATKQGCNYTPNEIMEGACLECDCEVNLLYCLAVQAAELRERLKFYEDLEEQGRLIVPPCKVGDTVWYLNKHLHITLFQNSVYKAEVVRIVTTSLGTSIVIQIKSEGICEIPDITDWGISLFPTREEAEQALSKLQASYKQVKEGVQE